jgi:hypothetical protein
LNVTGLAWSDPDTDSSHPKFEISKLFENVYVREISDKTPDYPRDSYFYMEELDFKLDSGKDIDEGLANPEDRGRDYSVRFAEDVDVLTEDQFNLDRYSGEIEIDLDSVRPLQAVVLDGIVRYECKGDNISRYVLTALGVLERFGFDNIDEDEWPEELLKSYMQAASINGKGRFRMP